VVTLSRGRRGKRKTKIAGAFAPRLVEMLESPAHRVLSLSARRILDRIEIELANHGGCDNGALPCTYENFRLFGIDRDGIAPALRELEALGFIEWHRGSAGNADFRRAQSFRLTYRHTDTFDPTDEWRRVRTEADAMLIARAARLGKRNFWPGKKRVTNRAKPSLSIGETPIEDRHRPIGKNPITGDVGFPRSLSISREGTDLNEAPLDGRKRRRRAGIAGKTELRPESPRATTSHDCPSNSYAEEDDDLDREADALEA
jgi:hypothetical protein